MAKSIENSQIVVLISRFFSIENTVLGDPKQNDFNVRLIGTLKDKNSEKGFDQILAALHEYDLVAIIRPHQEQHELIVIPDRSQPVKHRPILQISMFLVTLISVILTGGLYAFQGEMPENPLQLILSLVISGWPFALSLLSILGAHEFGHYFAGKKHGINVTLPLFIPFPFSTFGTMGAFISMRSLPKNRKQLFDLAVTGPICGLIISVIVLFIGLRFSALNTIPLALEEANGIQMEGNSLLYLFLKYLSFGKILPQPANLNGFPLLIFWLRYFFTGMPFPWGAEDVMLHPVAWAGWAGLFITTINLLPVGQLDGGHIFQSVFGSKAIRFIYPVIIALLVIFGFFWAGWWTWAVILFFFGLRYAEPLDQLTQLDPARKWVGVMMIIIFLITFIPVPITIAVP